MSDETHYISPTPRCTDVERATNCKEYITCPECREALGLSREPEHWLCPLCQYPNQVLGEASAAGHCQGPACMDRRGTLNAALRSVGLPVPPNTPEIEAAEYRGVEAA